MVKISLLTRDENVVRDWFSNMILNSKKPIVNFLFGDFKALLSEPFEDHLNIRIKFEPFVAKEFIYYLGLGVLTIVVLFVLGLGKFFLILSGILFILCLVLAYMRSKFFYQPMIKKALRKKGYVGLVKFIKFGGDESVAN